MSRSGKYMNQTFSLATNPLMGERLQEEGTVVGKLWKCLAV